MDSVTEDKQLGREIKKVQCMTKDNSTTAHIKIKCHTAGRILGREGTKVPRVTTGTEGDNVRAAHHFASETELATSNTTENINITNFTSFAFKDGTVRLSICAIV
jgi:ribosomal protein L1